MSWLCAARVRSLQPVKCLLPTFPIFLARSPQPLAALKSTNVPTSTTQTRRIFGETHCTESPTGHSDASLLAVFLRPDDSKTCRHPPTPPRSLSAYQSLQAVSRTLSHPICLTSFSLQAMANHALVLAVPSFHGCPSAL